MRLKTDKNSDLYEIKSNGKRKICKINVAPNWNLFSAMQVAIEASTHTLDEYLEAFHCRRLLFILFAVCCWIIRRRFVSRGRRCCCHWSRSTVEVEDHLVASTGNDTIGARQVSAGHSRRVAMTYRLQQQPVDALVTLVSHGQFNVLVHHRYLHNVVHIVTALVLLNIMCAASYQQTAINTLYGFREYT